MGELKVTDRTAKVLFGHPWIFSDEVQVVGQLAASGTVKVLDSQGQFVAFALYNQNSKICGRVLTRDIKERVHERSFYRGRLLAALRRKRAVGQRGSFRWCFSEGDGLPGLIVDLYLCESVQVVVAQVLSLPLDQLMGEKVTFFEEVVNEAHAAGFLENDWDHTIVVLRNDANSREKEGLKIEPAQAIKGVRDFNLRSAECIFWYGEHSYSLHGDLLMGQKTGLFLDQSTNIGLIRKLLKGLEGPRDRPVRILDLCCYVGHWSTALSDELKAVGRKADVHLLDVSQAALDFAKDNCAKYTEQVSTYSFDALAEFKEPGLLEPFDIIIADPPGFIKRERDRNAGASAYLRLFQRSFEMVAPGGIVVCCSCSGLLEREEFEKLVQKALTRSKRSSQIAVRGGMGADHTTLLQFPQGQYLKMIALWMRD